MVMTRELTFNLEGLISSMGMPVKGALIRIFDYWQERGTVKTHFLLEQRSSEKGTFSFNLRKGIYCVEIIPSDNTRYARQTISFVRLGANRSLAIQLRAGYLFSGQVKNSDGVFVPNAEVCVFADHSSFRATQLADSEGRFCFTLPAGTYCAAVSHRQSLSGRSGSAPFLSPGFEKVELRKDLHKDLVLPPMVRAKIFVRDKAGHPLFGVKARISKSEHCDDLFLKFPFELDCETGLDGSFEVDLQPSTYDFNLCAHKDLNLAERTSREAVLTQNSELAFMLEPACRLTGHLRRLGRTVPFANITLSDESQTIYKNTDSDGEFHASVAPGLYELVVQAQPDSLGAEIKQELASHNTMLRIDGDLDLEVELEEGTLIAGSVADLEEQRCAGMLVSFYPIDDFNFESVDLRKPSCWSGLTADDGTFEARLVEGSYWLVLNKQVASGQQVQISGRRQSLSLTASEICSLSLRILDTDGPVNRCKIYAQSVDSNEELELIPPVVTDESGFCRLFLPKGEYSLLLAAPTGSQKRVDKLLVETDISRRISIDWF